MKSLSDYHPDALVGVFVLGYLLWTKVVERRARKGARVFPATVLKIFPHRHCTSYFVRYEWQGRERIAEYRGAPMRRQFEPGDTVQISLNPDNTPDVPLPETTHNAPNAGVGSGTCNLAGAPFISGLDLFYIAASLFVIIRSFA